MTVDGSTAVLRALQLARTGRVYSLAQPLGANAPMQPHRVWHVMMNLEQALPGAAKGSNRLTAAEEVIVTSMHNGTHIDALGHVAIGDQAYGGAALSEIVTSTGFQSFGIDTVPPLILRGVLLDVAAQSGVDVLEPGTVVTARELERAEAASATVLEGDLVMIHTGWGRLWDADPDRYRTAEPGIGLEAAQWLTDRKVSAIGADNWAVEVVPMENDDEAYPVHQHCLTKSGCFLIENLNLAELAEDGITECCVIVLPLRVEGASGSMVSPAALV